MDFGQALGEVRKEHQLNQDFAESDGISRDAMSKYETGRRRPPVEVMRRAADRFDDARLYVAAASEVTGDAWIPWLNNVDLHRSSVHIKTLEELREALDAMENMPIAKTADQLTAVEQTRIRKGAEECVEAITALTHYAAALCKAYDLSFRSLWLEHRRTLRAKRYILD